MATKLELVSIPVTDVDQAKAFYADKVGFGVDLDSDADRAITGSPTGCALRSSPPQGRPA
jgi:catechol 2,3-dioxygenase-like lactoylglutathione lyase family enzyme